MSLKLNQHISREFNAELERIRSQVLRMGGLVEAQLVHAVQALREGDSELADEVLKADQRINQLEVEIDAECTEIVALRQPAASDLRLIMGVIKTISDLERIGDEAKRVAKMADSDLAGHLPEHMSMEINYMADLARGMLHDVLDAFARLDADDALKIAQRDRQVDLKYESITRQLITYMVQDAKSIPTALAIMWAVRSLERIGDRSQNIAEHLIYLVRGEDVRHVPLDDLLQSANPRKTR